MMRGSPLPATLRGALPVMPFLRSSSVSLSALFLVALVALGPPQALAQKREGTFGKGRPGGPLLKPAELRDCLARQDRIHKATDETAREQARLRADRTEIERLGTTLKEQTETLDRKNADAVTAYNAQVAERDRMIDTYQQAVPAFNTRVESLKAEQESFAKACEGRRYDEDDAAAIRKGS